MKKTPVVTASKETKNNLYVLTHGDLKWIYIEKAGEKEIDYLAQNFKFNQLNLDDITSRVQRPKIDRYKDHLFIVLHFPVYDKNARVTARSEVDIFMGDKYLVTIHKSADLRPLNKFFKECQLDENIRQNYMGRGSSYLFYHLLDSLVNYCFPILEKVTDNIEKIEDLIFSQPVPHTVKEISLIRRDLISFRRVVHPQIAVLEALEHEKHPVFKEEQDVYFGDIADHIRKIWDGLEDCKEVVDGLADTSNWLTSHRIQEVMRSLTIIMAVIAPATLIASIYGMNIALPGANIEGSFLPLILIFVAMLITGIAMILYLRRWQ
jgi:magnesium transporter